MSARSLLVKQLPCIACWMEGLRKQCGVTHEHHLNLDQHAGQKRRGDEYSVPLGAWHHVGEPPMGMTATQAAEHFGPSLARSSKKFRERYGSDEELLAMTNEQLERVA